MKVSVVIPCLNSAATLEETLQALLAQQWSQPWEIVVSDNGSTDQTLNIVKRYQEKHDRIRIADASARRGTSFAINTGVKEARGRSVLFCDSDDVPGENYIAIMGEALESYDFVAAKIDIDRLNGELTAVSRSSPQCERLDIISYPPYLPHAGGGTIGVRRDVFLKVGGYDEEFVYLHDTDFCFKVQLAGHPLQFIPEAVMCVRYRDDLDATFRQARNWAQYNVLLAKKYSDKGEPPAGRWSRFFSDSKRALRRALRWRRFNEDEKSRAIWMLGWQLGKAKGVLRYWVPPF